MAARLFHGSTAAATSTGGNYNTNATVSVSCWVFVNNIGDGRRSCIDGSFCRNQHFLDGVVAGAMEIARADQKSSAGAISYITTRGGGGGDVTVSQCTHYSCADQFETDISACMGGVLWYLGFGI